MPKKYIELEAAIRALQPTHAPAINEVLASVLRRVPAADVAEVKHGRWHDVYMSSASSFVGTCSICGISNDIPPVSLAKYCPNCGAKMDGGQGE